MNKAYDLFRELKIKYAIEDTDKDAVELEEILKSLSGADKPAVTESGLAILEYLQSVIGTSFKAKDIAEGMGIPSRKISGSMRKLVSDNYVEKLGQNPVIYSLTEKGKQFDVASYKESLGEN